MPTWARPFAVLSTIWLALVPVTGVLLIVVVLVGALWAIFGSGSWLQVLVLYALSVGFQIVFQSIGYLIRLPAARWMD